MRRNRIFLKVGVLAALLLAGLCFFVVMPVSTEVAVVAVDAAAETVIVGAEVLPFILIAGIGLAALLTFLGRVRQNADQPKRKHDDEIAPYLDAMIEQGVVRLEDDGELPELTPDDLYLDEKSKRHDDE